MMQSPPKPDAALSVSQLTFHIKDLLETAFERVSVVGEISNFARPQSGHCYFSLKDDTAQIRAVMWRGAASRLRFELEDGMEVVCRGHLDVYAPRGSYQLVVESIVPQGVGALELALRKLREKLAAEGLFDPARKRPLPPFPRQIGVVTSPTGAAIRDFLEVLRRRWRGARVLILPVRVQGEGSADEIAAAISTANRLVEPPDVLVVTRGGGSLEDLWSFNEEIVVRAIAASKIPTICGVGHEIDVSLADLAADVRALTPSEAAERVLPAHADVLRTVRTQQQRMLVALRRRVEQGRTRVDGLAAQRMFRRPFDLVHDLSRRLDELSLRGQRATGNILRSNHDRLATLAGKLESLNPLAVLGRGYTITEDAEGHVVTDSKQLALGDEITTRFANGRAVSKVTTL